jgi:transposase
MSISERTHVSEGEVPARRVEIFTGAGRRRSWSAREKAAIVAESFEEGVRACHVARRHGLTPQQLFAWRREARRKAEPRIDALPFVPAIVETANTAASPNFAAANNAAGARPHSIELDIEGSSVWVWSGADAAMVAAIIGALKATK